ncbi:hypothetical protein NLJ89_g1522 [Agrocybe chaxingu]|uniref:Ribosome biogenesis protein NSA1 n=1 Tax=Agrocybe chaxingu TaxID=84603 RepID=A0A9W8MZW1_9AGAR|nr:hypothetical protein NLJ89_g1522 [Agrocybe chaxingu]
MSRFVLGDELGNIKVFRHGNLPPGCKTNVKTVYSQEDSSALPKVVQKLATALRPHSGTTLAAAFSDGSCSLSTLNDDDTLTQNLKWTEPRITQNKFIGLSLNQSAAFACTSNGMLRRVPFTVEHTPKEASDQLPQSDISIIPSRLFDWRMPEDCSTFAYGGDEVDLSLWDTELAFTSASPSKNSATSRKRKRNDDLFSGEIPNDHLTLRQPIRITTLTFLQSTCNSHHLMTGTQFGDLRRYDTRAARRPISNWTGLGKRGGVRVIEKGISEHELFMGDNGSNLYSIDLRTGRILYGYKGFSGAVTSISPSPTVLASVSLDRNARLHSTFPPSLTPGNNQDGRGEVLDKWYLTTVPTVVVWDKRAVSPREDEHNDDVWDNLEHIM